MEGKFKWKKEKEQVPFEARFEAADFKPAHFALRLVSFCVLCTLSFFLLSLMADHDQNDPVATPTEASPSIRKYKGVTYDMTDPKYQGLSKNGLKRLLKEEHWNATREERNKVQKAKKKQKSAERRKLIEDGVIPAPPPKRAKVVELSAVRVAVDCSFSSYMHETVTDSPSPPRETHLQTGNQIAASPAGSVPQR